MNDHSDFIIMILKLIAAAAALIAAVSAVISCWDSIMHYASAGRKLYCHEMSIHGKRYHKAYADDYSDLTEEDY